MSSVFSKFYAHFSIFRYVTIFSCNFMLIIIHFFNLQRPSVYLPERIFWGRRLLLPKP